MHDIQRLFAVLDATWPAARTHAHGPWTIRCGQDGGQRVSAAIGRPGIDTSQISSADIAEAVQQMHNLGQHPIFQIRPEQDQKLDDKLDEMGFAVRDPVLFYQIPLAELAQGKPVPVVQIWPPLAMACDIWQTAGIGAGRQAVMARAQGPKTVFLARKEDRPAGATFAAIDADIAMLHAIEVPEYARRKGAGRDMLHAAADWALANGATDLALVVTRANLAARALYDSLHMIPSGGYHYRVARPQ